MVWLLPKSTIELVRDHQMKSASAHPTSDFSDATPHRTASLIYGFDLVSKSGAIGLFTAS